MNILKKKINIYICKIQTSSEEAKKCNHLKGTIYYYLKSN